MIISSAIDSGIKQTAKKLAVGAGKGIASLAKNPETYKTASELTSVAASLSGGLPSYFDYGPYYTDASEQYTKWPSNININNKPYFNWNINNSTLSSKNLELQSKCPENVDCQFIPSKVQKWPSFNALYNYKITNNYPIYRDYNIDFNWNEEGKSINEVNIKGPQFSY